jgi:hypothetical protein
LTLLVSLTMALALVLPHPAVGEGEDPAAPADTLAPRELEKLELALRASPGDGPTAHRYRLAARSTARLDDAIQVLEGLAREHPEEIAPRFELALAMIDQMAFLPPDDLAGQGLMAGRASRQLNQILKAEPVHWAALYARGMLHLMWPRRSQHPQRAVDDLGRLVAIQETQTQGGQPAEPYFVHGFIGLGDAYHKNMQPKFARQTWMTGRRLFPEDAMLALRLEMSLDEAEEWVLDRYQLTRPFDTDMSFLWTN